MRRYFNMILPSLIAVTIMLLFMRGLVLAGIDGDWKVIPAAMAIYFETLRTITKNLYRDVT